MLAFQTDGEKWNKLQEIYKEAGSMETAIEKYKQLKRKVMKWKCLCSLAVMICCYCTAFGQWVVSDPALTQLSKITWAKELKQAYEQFQVLGESRDILTKSLDLYRQVNGVIKTPNGVAGTFYAGEMLELAAKECTRSDVLPDRRHTGNIRPC